MKYSKNIGFTLIELLVVITIIAIIAGLVIVRIMSVSDDAIEARMKNDLTEITKIINIAKSLSGKPLNDITGSENSSWNNCSGRDLRNIEDSDPCISDIKSAFLKIEEAARVGIQGSYPRDKWGSPYLIDENEDTVMYPCGSEDPYGAPGQLMKDMIASVGSDGVLYTSDDIWSGELSVLHIDNVKCPN